MNNRISITIAVIAAAMAAPTAFALGKYEGHIAAHLAATAIGSIAAPTDSTNIETGAKLAEATGSSTIAVIGSAPTPATADTNATAAPGFYINKQRITASTIKKTVYDYGSAGISFIPPAPQKSMPSIMLAGMPDKSAALHLVRAFSDVYRRAGKPFVASAECVSPKGHRYMYSFVYTPHATGHHQIWQDVNGEAVTKMIADKCPPPDLIVSINPAK